MIDLAALAHRTPSRDHRGSTAADVCRWVPDLTSLCGSWEGIATDTPFLMTVEESGAGSVRGAAMAVTDGERVRFAVAGTHSYPHVRLTLRTDGHPAAEFVGFFRSEDFIAGELDGGPLGETALDLYRR